MNDLDNTKNSLNPDSDFCLNPKSNLSSRSDNMTFDKRLQIEARRRFVSSYRHSNLGSSFGYQRAKSLEVPPRQQTVSLAPDMNRSQPTTRRYDPFHR